LKCPDRPRKEELRSDSIIKKYEIQVITPIFGGGVVAGVNDPITPIRPSSIRGHLRFWWRATRGASFGTAELLKQEGEIWGTMEEPSKVALRVELKSSGKEYPCAHLPEDKNFPRFERNHPPYALFPFQGSKRERIPPAKCRSDVCFELKLNFPQSISEDIEAAVWAWSNFGGIGARTRRGCGALYCRELSPTSASGIGTWYRSSLKGFRIIVLKSRDWPILPDSLLVRRSSDAMQAWSEVVGLMQTFRQGQNVGRNPGKSSNRPGRSRWPEPETIRRATSRRDSKNSRMMLIPDDAFPKAEFGLPIVFHFKDYGDPEDTELYPVVNGEERTRMASPLILRPIFCQNGEVLQMVIRLNAFAPDEVVLEKAPGSPTFIKIRDPMLSRYPNSPLSEPKEGAPVRSSSGSAIEGFVAFAVENGFVEVV
jgi:CRISPR-associated protein Cmr1